ncbi:MAG TPA: hypothetical protein VMU19_00685, partial [Bryobacteraceae bacterium]|nr:hypothetical protein [Bryobacteraceae bacterium]
IKELRPGHNGTNPKDPTFANYDESKANPYPNLPDPLTLKNGKKVTTAADWWKKRRPEIVEDFDREVYGRVPKVTPKVKWVVDSTENGKNGDVDVVTKQLRGVVDNSSYPLIKVEIALTLVTPANAKGPVPVVMQFGGGFGGGGRGATPAQEGPPYGPNAFSTPPGGGAGAGRGAAGAAGAARGAAGVPGAAGQGRNGSAAATILTGPGGAAVGAAGRAGFGGAGRGPAGPSWQQQVLARGWGYAQINPGSIQADNGAGLDLGIIGLCNKGQPRKPDDWGALRAWAWGVSRAIDYFETDKAVDAKHIALEGHSRYGKATIVSMAYEPRLWTAYVSSSGEGGAKLHRRNWGEIIENVDAVSEYHWMAGNFLKYAGPLNWNDLPVDSHELVAMCAPRPVFLSAGKGGYDAEPGGDSWVDAKGTFMAGAAASPVYELLGAKGMGTNVFPPIETLIATGDVAFRQHSSGHTDVPNWPYFLDFAAKHMELEKTAVMPKVAKK